MPRRPRAAPRLGACCTPRARPDRYARPKPFTVTLAPVSVLAAAVALADLCGAAPAPAAQSDAADSASYTAVGDDARDAGDLRAAVIAYRKAIAADPGNQRATAELAAICR